MNGFKALGQHYRGGSMLRGIILRPNQQPIDTCIPLQQWFMVKPQPKPTLWLVCLPHNLKAKSSERVSIDSMNNVVQSRKAGRVSTDEPDFIVVKAGFEYGETGVGCR